MNEEELKDLAVDWCVVNGLVVRSPATKEVPIPTSVLHAPVSLYPSRIPRDCYERAVKIQPLFNALVDIIAKDEKFIHEVMEEVSKVDDFVGQCYKIYQAVLKEGSTQPIAFGIHRSDYLLHKHVDAATKKEHIEIQQVELNTIAASFSSLSAKTTELHRFLQKRSNMAHGSLTGVEPTDADMPDNISITALPKGIARAFELYGARDAVVVMVVQPGERNIFDQRWIENTLFEKHGIPLVRKSLKELMEQSRLVGSERKLFMSKEVAVVYFRAGYTPDDYPTQTEWQARLIVERSHAIKCPNVTYHLVGSKKVQQVLAQPRVLEKFITNPTHASNLRSVFTGLYPLDSSPDGIQAYESALKNPDRYVMKPQREGGGNNLYGPEIPAALGKLSPAERNAYILMDLIKSPAATGVMVRQGQIIKTDVVSELGIYGVWISEGDVVHMNEFAGHLLRTKSASSNEGGVNAGFAVLDSPQLV
ncbi:hypothetical protein HDV05_005337 [Chytridiales sp. JEL 0842]|nr:hypothetical protein HDV05_005337 [Chytridiales sp. JEL 0842]